MKKRRDLKSFLNIRSTYFYTIILTIFKGKTFEQPDPRCEHELDHGSCHAYIPIYYFNTKTGDCEKSYYGECGENSNRFSTLEKCKQFCILIYKGFCK